MKGVAETTFWNGIFTNAILVPALFISKEAPQWKGEFADKIAKDQVGIFVMVCIATAIAKQLEYMSKFAVVQRVSALFECKKKCSI